MAFIHYSFVARSSRGESTMWFTSPTIMRPTLPSATLRLVIREEALERLFLIVHD